MNGKNEMLSLYVRKKTSYYLYGYIERAQYVITKVIT